VILPDLILKFTFSIAATFPKYLASELTSTATLDIPHHRLRVYKKNLAVRHAFALDNSIRGYNLKRTYKTNLLLFKNTTAPF
jgi:hypothetical protein